VLHRRPHIKARPNTRIDTGQVFRNIVPERLGEVRDVGEVKVKVAAGVIGPGRRSRCGPILIRRSRATPGRPMSPTKPCPGTFGGVVHLHRRAGFAATWNEIQRDLKRRPRSVNQPAPGREVPIPRHPRGFRRVRRPPGRAGAGRARAQPPQGWWVYRMLFGAGPADRAPDALVARPLRHQQPQGQRPDPDAAAERDPALALPRPVRPVAARDAPRPGTLGLARRTGEHQGAPQRKPGPRALGAVYPRDRPLLPRTTFKEAARALAGWKLVDDEARLIPMRHDRGAKNNPRPYRRVRRRRAGRVARRSSRHVPPLGLAALPRVSSARGRSTIGQLARSPRGLRAHDLDIGWGVATVLPARASSSTASTWVGASPARSITSWVRCGPSRCSTRSPSTPVAGRLVRPAGAGPVLSAPTSGGWPGRAKLDHDPLSPRAANFAAALVGVDSAGLGTSFDPIALATAMASGETRRSFARLLLGCRWPRGPHSMPGTGPAALVRLFGFHPRRRGFDPFSLSGG